jgi:hypothetical protein
VIELPLASPLDWPTHVARRKWSDRRPASFGSWTVAKASVEVHHQLDLLGAEPGPVLSTNLDLRLDGRPRSNQAEPQDPAVAVYWRRKGETFCLTCDAYTKVAWNLRAIAKHIEALRGLARWGCGTSEQAFTGYKALPAPRERLDWETYFYFGLEREHATAEQVLADFRTSAKLAHPDVPGGSAEDFNRLVKMRDAALAALNGRSS